MSIQWKPDDRTLNYFKLCGARSKDRADNVTAEELGFGSPEALYRKLATDGFPVCPECGSLHPDEQHVRKHEKKQRPRRPRGAGKDARALTPAERADDLIAAAIERQERARSQLPFLNEWFVDGRFVTEAVYPEDSGEYQLHYQREAYDKWFGDYAADMWERDCEEHGNQCFQHISWAPAVSSLARAPGAFTLCPG